MRALRLVCRKLRLRSLTTMPERSSRSVCQSWNSAGDISAKGSNAQSNLGCMPCPSLMIIGGSHQMTAALLKSGLIRSIRQGKAGNGMAHLVGHLGQITDALGRSGGTRCGLLGALLDRVHCVGAGAGPRSLPACRVGDVLDQA